jgi:hypothetical protein
MAITGFILCGVRADFEDTFDGRNITVESRSFGTPYAIVRLWQGLYVYAFLMID